MKLIINDINIDYIIGTNKWCFMHYILHRSGHPLWVFYHKHTTDNAYDSTIYNIKSEKFRL
jgi:hypothetical protein